MKYKNFLAASLGIFILACGTCLAFDKELPAKAEYKPIFAWPQDQANKVTIKGRAQLTESQMVAFIKANTPTTKLNCSVEELVHHYYEESAIEGIRADLALCQAIHETGWFCYGGTVVPEQNNYCGLVTTSSTVKGHYFATPKLGARAHLQHLLVYAQKEPPVQEIIDPRYHLVIETRPEIYGNMKYWTDLDGRWAVPGKGYGERVLNLWTAAKTGAHNESLLAELKIKAEENSKDPKVWHELAKTAKNFGKYQEATKAYDKVLDLNPKEEENYLELAELHNEWGRASKAIEVYDKLLKLNPLEHQAIRGKAYSKAALGKNLAAVVLYSQALRLAPNDTLALYNRGNLLKKLGKTEAGEKDLILLKELQNEK